MKSQIDSLVRQILAALAQPSPIVPELAAYMQLRGLDGHSQAVEMRCTLERWAEYLPSEKDRQYAQEQLDALPFF